MSLGEPAARSLAGPLPPRSMVPAAARITDVKQETEGTFTWSLDVAGLPGGGLPFQPGQFNMLYLFGAGEVPISISGDPARPEELIHTIRAVGAVTRGMAGLGRGDVVGLRGPFGAGWPLEAARGRDLVIMAGGLGLAPLRPAILQALARRGDHRSVTVLYGARTPADILYPGELEAWRARGDARVEVTVDRAGAGFSGHVGVVPALLAAIDLDPANAVAMICGPEIMMRFSARALFARGVPKERVYVSMERNMKCGAGLCGHCQFGPTFVCKDGPVYRFDSIERIFYLREI
jgi:NAD(P)H-flavin reductase